MLAHIEGPPGPMGIQLSGRPTRTGRYGPSLALSLAVHGLLLCAFATTTIKLLPSQPMLIPITLLASNPAPPPPPAAAPALEPPAVVPADVPTRPEPVEERKTARPTIARKPVSRPSVQPPSPVDTATTQTAADAGGVAGGVTGGELGGQVGGTVGGSGDQVWLADQVASAPAVLSGAKPAYPPIARARGIEGLVVLETVIDRAGHIEANALHVVESIPGLDQAALDAVQHWRFRPGRDQHGDPVRVLVRVPIRFQLR